MQFLRHIADFFAPPSPPRRLDDDPASLAREHSAALLAGETLDAAELAARFPPRIDHAKKRLLFDLALARGVSGPLTVRRYREIPLPEKYLPFAPSTTVEARRGFFTYATTDAVDHWFLNFAHHDLFHGYGLFMFAQDEIQVAEHPALACLREWMLNRGGAFQPAVVEGAAPTPVLIRGIERVLRVDTRTIYGARFAAAEEATIRAAVQALESPARTNILAMEAPIASGNKIYTRSEIEWALRTAYSGFRATVLASAADFSPLRPVTIHTGNWGCGAYGGSRPLMFSVQIIAARLAGAERIVFYCGADSTDDVAAFDADLSRRFQFTPGVRTERVIDRLVAAAFPWGRPDGN